MCRASVMNVIHLEETSHLRTPSRCQPEPSFPTSGVVPYHTSMVKVVAPSTRFMENWA